MQVFLDESGDLGWALDRPFRHGGSSRYLGLAFLFLPQGLKAKPKGLMLSLYDRFGWKREKKAHSATLSQQVLFCRKVLELLKKYRAIRIESVVVKKKNVPRHVRLDPDKLYMYLTGLVVPGRVRSELVIDFIPDERTVKLRSANSLVDYLQTKLWFDYRYLTRVTHRPSKSHLQYNTQFTDWLSHCIWSKFEDHVHEPYRLLNSHPHVKVRKLYF